MTETEKRAGMLCLLHAIKYLYVPFVYDDDMDDAIAILSRCYLELKHEQA